MRIAHVTATFPPYWAGTGNVAYHNARVLHERGHHVHVFTADTPGKEPLEFPFEVSYLPSLFRIGNAPFTPALPGALRGFDLIHLHYPYIFGAELTVLAARRSRTPLVATYHNDLLAGGVRGALFRVYTATSQRWVLANSHLIATSRDYGDNSAMARTRPRGARVFEVANGVDLDAFRPPEGAPESAEAQRREGRPYALFVGGLDPAHHFKGVHVLIEAHAETPELDLVIVGDGALRADYERRAAEVSPGRVRFVGKVPLATLIELYQHANVTVLPSVTQGEAFGMVLAESMACGTPVIASDLPGVRTVVGDGETGRLVPPGDVGALRDALHEVAGDEAHAATMGAAGLERVRRRYGWEVVVDQLERVYADVLGQPLGAKGAAAT